ncbi:MAG: PAS domain-containing protein, partial [Candidatus Electrothrix sp. AR4]|nr:PAS domain-containing protein [Candidatus Electrothrix sp. AR4]
MKQDLQFTLKVFDALSLYGILFNRDGIVITANRAFLDTIGLRRKEIVGMSKEDLEPYCAGLKEQFDLLDLDTNTSRVFRSQLTDTKGTVLVVEHNLIHVVSAPKEIIACIGHTVKNAERVNDGEEERRLQEAEKRIEAANQRKRKFIANINHEIRTPMNAIIGYAEMLAESELGKQQRRFVDTIRKNSTSLVAIINDIMELSKLETGKVKVLKSTANLPVLIEQLHDLFIEQIQAKNLDFSCLKESNLPEFYVMDANHCRQVLANLLSNAIKFTDKGKIILSLTGTQIASKLYTLSFQVTDTGRGM